MNYKETLFFISKCLTISLEDSNRQEIEKQLKSNSLDWDSVVKVSTSHYVFPALYCNLQRAHFLHYLPDDLVGYMKYITNLNRVRNEQIIRQAQELNNHLLSNNITPIFLKGTGNLLAGFYEDIAERMVGDIDLIFSKEDYPKAITILTEFGYYDIKNRKYHYPDVKKHYRRLQKKLNVAAIEIHSKFFDIQKYNYEFNYSFINKDIQVINGFRVLSYANKLNFSIIADQIHDSGFYYKRIALRNAYDVFLLSKKTSAIFSINTLDKLRHPLSCFLAACYEVFNKVESLGYNKNSKINSYLKDFNSQFSNTIKTERKNRRIKIYLYTKSRLNLAYKCLINKECRLWLLNSLTDKEFYKRRSFVKKIIK